MGGEGTAGRRPRLSRERCSHRPPPVEQRAPNRASLPSDQARHPPDWPFATIRR
ncbi:hypothetical protein M427DRAFT_192182 [Gonapodya prolifera JEL478]|uniref:Uncharacterized protein n=1 Tax=Gonapodya prolifera (strain JEL478) TaxID=1344416 RepID=A0A139A002_GONPJ|nr:hypothetical protein M427DRAFT_192182 [Gonapodya prolifera JEL478]|eukprot:KXS10106.1 hypothetical protein M427DRAFT_192182 [Gonapodya prolifera JEL478]